jgi:hypothetical protein
MRALTAILPVVVDIRRHSEVTREMVHARQIASGTLASQEEATVAAWVARHDSERGDHGGARALEETGAGGQPAAAGSRAPRHERHSMEPTPNSPLGGSCAA